MRLVLVPQPHPVLACEIWRKAKPLLLAAFLVSLLVPAAAAVQPEHAPAPEAPAGAHTAEPGTEKEGHAAGGEEGIWPTVARILNFAILVGGLVYLLRSPIAGYLQQRSDHIRADLVKAAEMKEQAGRQLADIDRRMAALPAELAALRARGAQEISQEEQQIDKTSAAERVRLLEQARREIDLRLRVAQRELVRHAAALAVQVASTRIRQTITREDHLRLVDRYLERVESPGAPSRH